METELTGKHQIKLRELDERNETAYAGGGSARVEKHKTGGRLTARERLEVFLDPGSFVELDLFVSHKCDNFGMKE